MTSVMTKTAKGRRGPATEKLPAEGTQARRFGKTRSAQSAALLEDYVELIADLLQDAGEARPTDIARRLGVSHATAIKTIARLKRAGLATARPYRGVFLTEKGEAMAERVRIRHRLVVDVLCALGVPTESAEADAEGIEHHVSETTLKAFAHFVKSQRGCFRPRTECGGGDRASRAEGASKDTRSTSNVPDDERCSRQHHWHRYRLEHVA